MKVGFNNKEFNLKTFGAIGTTFGLLGTLFGLFQIKFKTTIILLIIFGFFSVTYYILMLIRANKLAKITLAYGESSIEIKRGDIFSKEYKNDETFRIIAFNEYFDTIVDDKVISKRSINGKFILNEVSDVAELDKRIASDKHLSKLVRRVNDNRQHGKETAYKLGTVYKYSENVLFTAMTYFDDEDKATLTVQEYIKFLMRLWDEVNTFYAGKTVVIPLLGNGITRIDSNIYSSNQLLEIILWTFYLRRIKFRKPAKLIVLLDDHTNKNINYYKIRSMFNGLQE